MRVGSAKFSYTAGSAEHTGEEIKGAPSLNLFSMASLLEDARVFVLITPSTLHGLDSAESRHM